VSNTTRVGHRTPLIQRVFVLHRLQLTNLNISQRQKNWTALKCNLHFWPANLFWLDQCICGTQITLFIMPKLQKIVNLGADLLLFFMGLKSQDHDTGPRLQLSQKKQFIDLGTQHCYEAKNVKCWWYKIQFDYCYYKFIKNKPSTCLVVIGGTQLSMIHLRWTLIFPFENTFVGVPYTVTPNFPYPKSSLT